MNSEFIHLSLWDFSQPGYVLFFFLYYLQKKPALASTSG